jgi:hypothetical protein
MTDTSEILAVVALVPAVAGLGLLGWRALRAGGGVAWRMAHVPLSSTDAAQDGRLRTLERIVTGHLEAREPSGMLAAQLRGLAERRLALRHGVRLDAEPDRAAALLGPEVLALLETRPPRRLSLAQIDDVLRRIEEV